MSKDDLGGLPYQQASLVRQLLAERVNAEGLGLSDRVAAADKQLTELGYSKPKPADPEPVVKRDSPPEGRESRHERTQKADEKPAVQQPVRRRHQG